MGNFCPFHCITKQQFIPGWHLHVAVPLQAALLWVHGRPEGEANPQPPPCPRAQVVQGRPLGREVREGHEQRLQVLGHEEA